MKIRLVAAVLTIAAACTGSDKEDAAKGQVDESAPPSIPGAGGKSDASSRVVPVSVHSAHPYANNDSRMFAVPLTDLPSCAQRARLHFDVLQTEANYDFVTVMATGEDFSGTHDDTWTEWFDITGTSTRIRLETDESIVRHGFEIDAIEWDGAPTGCVAIAIAPCASDGSEVDLAQPAGTCECPPAPQCEAIGNIEVAHHLWRGFNNTTKTAQGGVALYTRPGPADAPETYTIGQIDTVKLAALVRRAIAAGLVHGPGYDNPIPAGAFGDELRIKAGALEVTFIAGQGSHTPEVQSIIDELEALFSCGTSDGGLSCGSGYVCEQAMCVEDVSCVCPALYNPVCGENGRTYGNSCEASCANVGVSHPGECGIPGDMCGGLMGLTCSGDNKCRFGSSQFSYPYPDASGVCVAPNYCDAPADCNGLPHPAVLGAWACNSNACTWAAGPQWQTLAGGRFETANPYANNMSVWHRAYLPAGAQAMRLNASRFRTEANYDKLEVWTWKSGAWQRVRSYTGTTGPSLADELPGQYHYLKFVSDSSVTASGVSLDVEYR